MAPIAVGDSLPDGQLGWFDENDQLQQVSVHALAAGKKVILFGVPGAFTPTCRSLYPPPPPFPVPVSSPPAFSEISELFGPVFVFLGERDVFLGLVGAEGDYLGSFGTSSISYSE